MSEFKFHLKFNNILKESFNERMIWYEPLMNRKNNTFDKLSVLISCL